MRYILILLSLIALMVPSPSSAGPKVVVFLVNSMSLDDISSPNLKNLHLVMSSGAVGLMNARTAGVPKAEKFETGLGAACLTIGSGTRTAGGRALREAYWSQDMVINNKRAIDLWQARTLEPVQKAEIVMPSIAEIAAGNAQAKYDIKIGAFANSLHAAGLKTAVVGNSDVPTALHREAVTIVVDNRGLVDYGEIGTHLYARDPEAPFGLISNTGSYSRALDRIWPKSDLIVVDPGDTFRADLYTEHCSVSQAGRLRSKALKNADVILRDILRRLDRKKDLLLVLSPNLPSNTTEDGQHLVPIAALGPEFSHGLLRSDSTRWTGLVTNSDVAPTILSFFGLAIPPAMVGRPVYAIDSNNALGQLSDAARRFELRAQNQVLSRWIASLCIVVVVLATIMVMLIRRPHRLIPVLAIFPASLLLAALLVPISGSGGLVVTGLKCLLISVLLTFLLLKVLRDPLKALAVLSLGLYVVLVGDLWFGSNFLRESVLSYSATEGARYYGLGNEYMGAMIGAVTIGTGILFFKSQLSARIRQLLAIVIFGIAVVVIGAPFLGTNTGGVMSIVPATLVALRLRSGRSIKITQVMGMIAAVVAVVGVLVLIDGLRGDGQSHMGRFGASLASDGINQFFVVVQRKLAMNFTLLGSSLWSRLMMASAAALLILRLNNRTNFSGALRKSVELYAALTAAIIGAASAFVFNDSGVVAAAICLLYPWTVAVILSLEYTQKEG